MAEKDISERTLFSHRDVFADVLNVLVFGGRQVIREEDLAEHSTRSAYKADGILRDMDRDIAKYILNGKVRISCIGIENQSSAFPYMPIRTIGYDGADYRAQLNPGNKDKYPVITIVLYFGTERWNKPTRLSECFDVPEELMPFFNDYKINLFEIAFLPEETVKMFRSDFGIVADYFVQSRKNRDYKPPKTVIKHVQDTLHLLSVFTGDRRFEEAAVSEDYKEETTMSNILEKLISKGRAEGEEKGRAEGEAKGRAEGRAEGEAKGRVEGYIKAAFDFGVSEENIFSNIIKEFSLSEASAAEYMEKCRPAMQ